MLRGEGTSGQRSTVDAKAWCRLEAQVGRPGGKEIVTLAPKQGRELRERLGQRRRWEPAGPALTRCQEGRLGPLSRQLPALAPGSVSFTLRAQETCSLHDLPAPGGWPHSWFLVIVQARRTAGLGPAEEREGDGGPGPGRHGLPSPPTEVRQVTAF